MSTREVPVHPRARGERSDAGAVARRAAGSSPRVRGTLGEAPRSWAARRFIPARAGNATKPRRPRSTGSVHPRARGERSTSPVHTPIPIGSSPRARGTPESAHLDANLFRFIPARAGNAVARIARLPRVTVHPRARGERPTCNIIPGCAVGSSPRARGTLVFPVRPRKVCRFIPARAGNARLPASREQVFAVHPRARGERQERLYDGVRTVGSSPRARGTRPTNRPEFRYCRFIPARAGNALPPGASSAPDTVHPRARGERGARATCTRSTDGSSPRARGTRYRDPSRAVRSRFIPARAGNAATRPSFP